MNKKQFQVQLSDHARRDIRDILAYTHRTWGSKQRLEYKQLIFEAISALEVNPLVHGKRYGFYVSAVGRHLIFYDVTDTIVSIVRILHERMDAPDHL